MAMLSHGRCPAGRVAAEIPDSRWHRRVAAQYRGLARFENLYENQQVDDLSPLLDTVSHEN
jgi:hypothetical protein